MRTYVRLKGWTTYQLQALTSNCALLAMALIRAASVMDWYLGCFVMVGRVMVSSGSEVGKLPTACKEQSWQRWPHTAAQARLDRP